MTDIGLMKSAFLELTLLCRTLWHLRPIQIIARLRNTIPRPVCIGGKTLLARHASGRWVLPARRQPRLLGPMVFRFLNETKDGRQWGRNASQKLWRYNIHYFDDLNAFDAETRRDWHFQAVDGWIRDHPPGVGEGWEPYPTSLRVVNWIKWSRHCGYSSRAFLASLCTQVRFLSDRVEYHLLGNHLFANAKALVFAGLYFEGAEADRWLARGLAILADQLPEQVLRDGGHFERSPMYHAIVLEDLLDLINATKLWADAIPKDSRHFVDSWGNVAGRMLCWLGAMCHPDGEIAFFNDSAFGIAPHPAELARYARDLGVSHRTCGRTGSRVHDEVEVGLHSLPESGYLRACSTDAVMLVDVAPIGPDYLPGHAHADTLSFELSVFGYRVIVNGGTSNYERGSRRLEERGTAAHSTVSVDGLNSSEVWASFRVGRRARPFGLHVEGSDRSIVIACSHDGYAWLPSKPVHRRKWEFGERYLVVTDRVSGRFLFGEARYHFHPEVACSIDSTARSGCIRLPNGRELTWRVEGGEVTLEDASFAPEFGRQEHSQCLVISFSTAEPVLFDLRW